MKTLDIVITDIDRLGMLMAQAADINEQIEALKDSIKNQGEGNYEGNHRLHASPQSLFGGFGTKFFRVDGILLVASVSRRGGKRD